MFKSKSECQKVKGLLSPYIDHQLTSSEQGLVEAHLEQCEACQRELESLRAVVSLVHRVTLVSPPRSFAIAEAVPKRRAVPVAVFGAATAVAVLLLSFFFVGDALNLFSSEVPVGVEERSGEAGLSPGQHLRRSAVGFVPRIRHTLYRNGQSVGKGPETVHKLIPGWGG